MTTGTAREYLLGHDAAELRRLEEQGALVAPATEAFLTLAGIAPGMRVLDLGTGIGDVAFLLAERVGPVGHAVGIDSSATALSTARRRAQLRKAGNVSFTEGDIRDIDPAEDIGGPFDAIVGRFVLLYMEDPAAITARFARALRPGGVILAMEYDMTAVGILPDPLPLFDQAQGWLLSAFARTGHDPALGGRLAGILRAAGLPDPSRIGVQTYVEPDDPAGARLLASSIRTLMPAILGLGIATADEVDIDTLEARLVRAQRDADAIVRIPALVGAWGRTPASASTMEHRSGTQEQPSWT